jgi:hypothetical protein
MKMKRGCRPKATDYRLCVNVKVNDSWWKDEDRRTCGRREVEVIVYGYGYVYESFGLWMKNRE